MQNNAIIVGAGWAGLSAAFTLAQKGMKVTLLEAAPQAGGRARSVFFPPEQVDNGQHLLLGAYHHTLKILAAIGISEQSVFLRTPLRLLLKNVSSNDSEIDLKINNLAFPFNLILGIISSKGLSNGERMAALRFCRIIRAKQFKIDQDISVEALLLQYKQPPRLIRHLWAPIALATLSTPIYLASAQVFLKVLKDSFTHKTTNAHSLLPIQDLSQVFPNPLLQFLIQKGSRIVYHQRVENLLIADDQCIGIQTASEKWMSDKIILATPPDTTAQLLNASPLLANIQQQLLTLQYQPITTVYLRFKDPIHLPHPMIGVIGGMAQWIFDRRFAGQPHIMSLVISGHGPHSSLDKTTLISLILQEVNSLLPHLEAPIAYKIICEKKAAFSCEVGINQQRPQVQTPIKGLCLAGDYTQTEYPATLEGAVRSGIQAAEWVSLNHSVEYSI